MKNATRYDQYDRGSYKIFAGEYAAQSVSGANPENRNTWKCALSEAAFMTGLERNADVVSLCSYAPLFAHTEGWQWTPDLIWFDNLHSFGSASYYVQKMFSTNSGTDVLPITIHNQSLTGQNGLYASAVADFASREIILKIVNANEREIHQKVYLDSKSGLKAKAIQTVLTSDKQDAFNTLEQPLLISPVDREINVKGKTAEVILAPSSFSVIKIKMAR
jgi:alpha-N-arabinofuranosidase